MFVSVLKGMKSDGSDDKMNIRVDQTDRLWWALSCTHEVMELLECKVRQHHHSTTIQPNQQHQAAIIADVVNDKILVEKREKVA